MLPKMTMFNMGLSFFVCGCISPTQAMLNKKILLDDASILKERINNNLHLIYDFLDKTNLHKKLGGKNMYPKDLIKEVESAFEKYEALIKKNEMYPIIKQINNLNRYIILKAISAEALEVYRKNKKVKVTKLVFQ